MDFFFYKKVKSVFEIGAIMPEETTVVLPFV